MNANIRVFDSPAAMAAALADDFHRAVELSKARNKAFTVALSGGHTPRIVFELLAKPPYQNLIDWQRVHFFWGDERCVPPDHPDSNYGMTRRTLLSHISIPLENVHRIQGESEPSKECSRYEAEIRRHFGCLDSDISVFDWIHLGLGTDGHTASLFPNSSALVEKKLLCAAVVHPNSGQQRITLTLPTINSARRISFLVTGQDKAYIVKAILSVQEKSESLPATLVHPEKGIVEWFLDSAAATATDS